VSLDSIRPLSLPRVSRGGKKLDLRRRYIRSKHRTVLPFSSLPLPLVLPPPLSPPHSSLLVGVNLFPRLSPNTELYKLKPIFPARLRSGFSSYFVFVYLSSANTPSLPRSSQATGGDIPLHASLYGNVKEDFLRERACTRGLPCACVRKVAHSPRVTLFTCMCNLVRVPIIVLQLSNIF